MTTTSSVPQPVEHYALVEHCPYSPVNVLLFRRIRGCWVELCDSNTTSQVDHTTTILLCQSYLSGSHTSIEMLSSSASLSWLWCCPTAECPSRVCKTVGSTKEQLLKRFNVPTSQIQ